MYTDTSITLRPDKKQFIAKYWTELAFLIMSMLLAGSDIPMLSMVAQGISVFLLLVLSYALWFFTTVQWEINDQNVIFVRGIFNRYTDYIELYRIVDYKEEQNLLQQLFNIKTLIIYSGDKSHPELHIYGLDETSLIVEYIRKYAEEQKQKKKIYEITNR